MKNDIPALAGIERTEDGWLDGFNVQWLAYDDRQFGDIISDWVSKAAQGNADNFTRGLGMNGELTKDDVTRLISGDKAPSRELTNFLCALVPGDVCSWLVLRNRGYAAAGNGHAQVAVSTPAVKVARLQKLQEITTAAPQGQNGHAASPFVDWLAETIDETARGLGRIADPEKSMANIAAALGISVEELKGAAHLKNNNIAEKAQELANLLNLEGDDFDQAISFAASAWSGAAAGKTDMAYPKAMRFLRRAQGMNQTDFAASLELQPISVAGIERATVLPHDNLLDRLTATLELSDDEQSLLRRISKQYDEALRGEVCARLEPVAKHFAEHGLTVDDMMHAATKQPQLFYRKLETLIGNIEGVVNHFKGDGLTLADYLGAATKHPPLFSQKPETLIGNIEGVVNRFKGDGLTLADYLGAATKQPQLFSQKPETLIGNIEGVVNRFKGDGLTLADYLGAATKQPQLFSQKPETLIGNIEGVVNHFKGDGLTLADYLGAATKLPQLFSQKPETLIGNIEGVVNHFKGDGLTLADYLGAATKLPQLISQKPETLIGNIEGVVSRFKGDGLTLKDYLGAVTKQPTLFYQKPETLIGNIEGVVNRFKGGLTLADYLGAATKRPTLFYQNPETLIGNIEGVVNHFKADGLMLKDYLGAATKQPTLFYQKPETLIGNIEGVVNHFKADGLMLKDYLGAATKHPPLFYQKPETLIGHINLVIGMYEKELIAFNGRERRKKVALLPQHDVHDHKPVFDFIIKMPALISLADNNYMLRTIYSAATHATPSSKILSKPKGKVEDELRTHLGHSDEDIPVPKIHMPEGLYDEFGNATGRDASGREITQEERMMLIEPHAKNILLRAIIREEILKGELGQDQGLAR